MAYHRYHGLDTKIVRIFNTYGPRMRVNDGRAVPAFISQALRNEDVTVFGDGSQTRSFTYITRSGRRHHPPDAVGRERAGEHRQPARDDDRGDRPDDHPDDRRHEPASSTSRCRPTTRRSASPTSPARARSCSGSRRWSSKKGLVKTIEYFRTKVAASDQPEGRAGGHGRPVSIGRIASSPAAPAARSPLGSATKRKTQLDIDEDRHRLAHPCAGRNCQASDWPLAPPGLAIGRDW